MKKGIIIGLYVSIIMLILSTSQSRWFGQNTPESGDISMTKPIMNEAQAYARTWIPPFKADPDLDKSWALRDDTAMDIKSAWKLGSCSKRVVVAIIDTGIDYNHKDLKANLWKNAKEIANNGIDDDQNGLIDDVIGWDFVSHDPLPYDDHGHGTHIAGIIGAVGGNGIGISGVCAQASLMILKYYDPSASGRQNLENTIQAFRYAINNGAHIINYSGGGSQFSDAEKQVILDAEKKGILVIAAAGNEKQNADVYGYYPASYDLDNIVSVAAITASHNLVDSSNYGIRKIDIAAPGQSIYSTLPDGKYGFMTGTSQATAFVTGIAALALSSNPTLSVSKLKSILLNGTDQTASLQGKIKTGGMINAYSVLQNATGNVTTNLNLF